MKDEKSSAGLRPLFIGRLTRVLFGVGTFFLVAVIGPSTLTTWGTVALVALGLSFLIGGIMGNPGCEVTAIPNLFLSEKKKVHCL
jgi:Na+/H+ antiporter NhaC